jgi:thioredoxin reductase
VGLETCQVAVVGAGPYGLSIAAHLKAAGVEVRAFGRPMEFWERHMPAGMLLRSAWEASHIADPDGRLSLDAYEEAGAARLSRPIPLASFIEYGHWYQRVAVPELDARSVVRIDRVSPCLQLTLSDGDRLRARRVVVATGLAAFGWRPPEFRNLPAELASHSSDHRDLGVFQGRRVAVIGAGQSAGESAALLAEGGTDVELVARAAGIRWLAYGRANHFPPVIRTLLYPPTDVGPPPLNWIVAVPELFRLVPAVLQGRVAHRCIRPAAADWLRSRLRDVRLTTGCRVLEAVPMSEGLRLRLSDSSERLVDHLLFATGYHVDVARLEFLGADLVDRIETRSGLPRLSKGFESSVPGLHFVGAPAAESFGPIMRFVAGTMYAARAVRQCVLEERPPGVAQTLRLYARQRERVGATAT